MVQILYKHVVHKKDSQQMSPLQLRHCPDKTILVMPIKLRILWFTKRILKAIKSHLYEFSIVFCNNLILQSTNHYKKWTVDLTQNIASTNISKTKFPFYFPPKFSLSVNMPFSSNNYFMHSHSYSVWISKIFLNKKAIAYIGRGILRTSTKPTNGETPIT